MMKKLITICLIAVMMLSCVACGGGNDETKAPVDNKTEAPADNKTEAPEDDETQAPDPVVSGEMNWWGWGAEWEDYSKWYETNYPDNQITINHVDYGTDTIQQALDNLLPEKGSTEGYPDMFCAEGGFVKKYIESDYTMDLGELFGGKDNLMKMLEEAGLPEYLIQIGTDSEGRIKGIALQNIPTVLFYRRSVVQELFGVSEPEDVYEKLAKDEATFAETVKSVGPLSNGKYAGLSSRDDAYYGYQNMLTTAPVVDGVIQVSDAIMSFMCDAKDWWDAGSLNDTGIYSEAYYKDVAGTSDRPAIFYPGSPWKMGVLMMPNLGDTYGDWAVTQSPYKTSQGGTWFCVGANTEKVEVVKAFLEYLITDTSEKGVYQMLAEKGDAPASSVACDRITAEGGMPLEALGGQNALDVYNKAAQA